MTEIFWRHLLVFPILIPLAGAIPAAVLHGRRAAWLSLVFSLLTLAADSAVLYAVSSARPLIYEVGGWASPYGVVLVADRFGATLALIATLIAAASAIHTLVAKVEASTRRLYHPLFLILVMALSGVFLTGDLFNLYVFMELVILSSVALVAMANRSMSAEVTFKYAVLAALGSALMLASVALVYAGTGTLNMADIAQRVRSEPPASFWPVTAAIMLVAFLIKGALVPFHFWQPDAHSTAPAPVSAMLSGVLVKVGVYGIARMMTLLFPESPVFILLVPLGAISALFGGVAALVTADFKRVLAYSTISNVGLILLALGWGGQAGFTAAIVHIINHALIKGGLFLAGGYVVERADEHEIARLGGIARLTPVGTAAFGLGALALAGLPPLSGFVSKLTLFQAGLAAGDAVFLLAAVVASALGIAYSVRAFVLVYWGETPERLSERWHHTEAEAGRPIAPLGLALFVLTLGLWPAPLVALSTSTAAELGQPTIYMAAVLGDAMR
ncbi:MAG: hypothetical protein M3220_06415 [Chloroflexota bacterium]|nr:hypothetical protein [Chloroflexota bacterium]